MTRSNDHRLVLPRGDFIPAYLKTCVSGELKEKIETSRRLLASCELCPRKCRVNRCENKPGFCRTGRYARFASAFAHFGEEDCLRGRRGSGTIFFSGCNLGCTFCQNVDISQREDGREVDARELAALMLQLQKTGCHNINLVTPTHVVPQILQALLIAVPAGLRLPLVYNTGGYDSLDGIGLMEGIVDIYMPDFKLWYPESCEKYLGARDYGLRAREAIKAMHAQTGLLRLDEDGLAVRGVLVRHLVMPGLLADTHEILGWLATELSPDTCLNLMDQYRPAHLAQTNPEFSTINRRIWPSEFEQALHDSSAAGLWRLA